MQKFYSRADIEAITGKPRFTKGSAALLAFAIGCYLTVGFLVFHPISY